MACSVARFLCEFIVVARVQNKSWTKSCNDSRFAMCMAVLFAYIVAACALIMHFLSKTQNIVHGDVLEGVTSRPKHLITSHL